MFIFGSGQRRINRKAVEGFEYVNYGKDHEFAFFSVWGLFVSQSGSFHGMMQYVTNLQTECGNLNECMLIEQPPESTHRWVCLVLVTNKGLLIPSKWTHL